MVVSQLEIIEHSALKLIFNVNNFNHYVLQKE